MERKVATASSRPIKSRFDLLSFDTGIYRVEVGHVKIAAGRAQQRGTCRRRFQKDLTRHARPREARSLVWWAPAPRRRWIARARGEPGTPRRRLRVDLAHIATRTKSWPRGRRSRRPSSCDAASQRAEHLCVKAGAARPSPMITDDLKGESVERLLAARVRERNSAEEAHDDDADDAPMVLDDMLAPSTTRSATVLLLADRCRRFFKGAHQTCGSDPAQ